MANEPNGDPTRPNAAGADVSGADDSAARVANSAPAHFDAEGRPRPWPKISSRHAPSLLLFRPRWDRLRNPRTDEEFDRLVLETPDWVNVVALTPARELILVEQYRFGAGECTLEIPGGVLDRGEEHGAAARRELAEETGHTGGTWTYLGAVQPNPAFHDNFCHHWLAEGVEHTRGQGLDAGEDIAIRTLTLDEVTAAIADGRIRHALVLTALCRVMDLRGIRGGGGTPPQALS